MDATALQTQQVLRAIFSGSSDAMMLADDEGQLVEVNSAACALFGVPEHGLLGSTLDGFFSSHRPEVGERLALGRPDGSKREVELSARLSVAPGRQLSVFRDLGSSAAAQEALLRSEALFRAVIERSADAISLTSADGTTRHLTPSAQRLIGWSAEEMKARTMRSLIVPEDQVRVAAGLDGMLSRGERETRMEFRVRHRDGSLVWFDCFSTNLLADADVQAIVTSYRDITIRKQVEAELHLSSTRLEEAQAIAHVGSWTSGLGADGSLRWSPECYRIFGLPVGKPVTVETFFGCVHPADRERVRQKVSEASESHESYDSEHRVVQPDGRVRWVHERAVFERDSGGIATHMIGTVQDITDSREAIEALRQSEQRYRRIIENTSEGVWMYDVAGVTTFMSARMAQMLGCTVEEAVGQPIFKFIDESRRAEITSRLESRVRVLNVGDHFDFVLRRKDGSPMWVSIQTDSLFDAEGRFEAAVAMVTDVSDQRRADETRARLASIIESTEDAVLSTTLDGIITSWNAGAQKLYQYSADEMIGQSILALAVPEHEEKQARILTAGADGQATHFETTCCRKDGTRVEVALTVSPMRDAAGSVIGVSRIARDLSSLRRAEAALRRTEGQFRQAQKMEAVGRLAGGVAHDFNNLLSVILSYASLAIGDLKEGDPMQADLEEIRSAGLRAADLTRQLLTFSRQQVLQPRVLDLNAIITGMKAMLSRLIGEDIEFTTLPGARLGRVLADPGQVEQMVMNLAVNARDAMPEGGQFTVETANVELDACYASGHLGVAPGSYAMITFTDTGVGMNQQTLARVFEPFFTTKERGKGTGLGLATVFGIVEQSGGHIGVQSEPGRGSTFTVYLPRTERDVQAASPTPEIPAMLHGSETILLVEDEEQVRVVSCAILRRNGYHVLDASNAGEAFLISKEYQGRIELLLTDVVMPRMGGRKLAELLTPLRPEMKLLFASGYTDDAIVHHGVLEAGVPFLQKPFTPDALLRKVREVLNGAAAGLSVVRAAQVS